MLYLESGNIRYLSIQHILNSVLFSILLNKKVKGKLDFSTKIPVLTLILRKLKVINLSHQYIEKGQPAHPCSLTGSYTVGSQEDQLQDFTLISLKMIMDNSKTGRWTVPFKKFGRFRVKTKQWSYFSTKIYLKVFTHLSTLKL